MQVIAQKSGYRSHKVYLYLLQYQNTMIKPNYHENKMKKQILSIIPIMLASIALAPIGASASTEESCSTTPATSPDLEGWTIETCGNGDVTWISPSGKRCVGNEQSGNLACEGQPPINVQ